MPVPATPSIRTEPPLDVAVLTQDPVVGGGARALLYAFVAAVRGAGRTPHVVYVDRGRATSLLRRSIALAPAPLDAPPLQGTAFPSLLPELDAFNQLTGGMRIARLLRSARQVWVVAAAASYGVAAARAGRPYACWVATGLDDEWRTRRGDLPHSRRLALAVNAPVLRRAERAVLSRARRVYGISPASAESLAAAAALPSGAVGALPIPVDVERFRPEPEEAWRATLDAPVLAFVGRADDPRKNLPLLLAAFAALRAHVPGARARLIGAPPRGPLPEGVEALGEVPDVAEALRGATLLVLPSRQEAFGIVVAEGLAAGLPAVVTPSGGPEALVRDSGGGVVTGDFGPETLASAIAELLRAPERLLAMRAAGRAYVEREHAPRRLQELLAPELERLEAA